MSRTVRRLPLPAALALTLVACQTATGPDATTSPLNADLAMIAAQSTAEDVEMMGGPGGPFGMGLFGGALGGPFGPLAARDLGCRSLEGPILTVSRTCTFTDASGATQASYDPTTTATARIQTEVEGEHGRDGWSATLHRTSDLTITGLAGAETRRTWNGTGRETVSRSRHADGAVVRAYTLETDVTIDAVVMPVPMGPDTWPLSGSITRTISGSITEGPRAGQSFERTVTITFDGTAQATLTVGGETFTVNLFARRVMRRR